MKYKVKKETQKENNEKGLPAKAKMLTLVIWGAFCVILYFTLIKFFAMIPALTMEIFLLFGVGLLFVNTIAEKFEKAKNPDGSEKLWKIARRIQLLKIFILPPTIIILVDLLISIYSFSRII